MYRLYAVEGIAPLRTKVNLLIAGLGDRLLVGIAFLRF
jgi:hypothetical protein